MKILFAPCHYIFAPNSGSECSWSYEIANRICTKYPECVVITGFISKTVEKDKKDIENQLLNSQNYEIIELQPDKKVIDMSLQNALLFNWQYFVKTRELLQLEKINSKLVPELVPSLTENLTKNPKEDLNLKSQKFQIIHHCLPFAIGSTYNLAALFGYFGNKKFVIGPLQTGLDYKDLDIDPSNFRSSNSKKNSSFKEKFNLKSFVSGFMNILAQILKPILGFLSYQTLLKADKIIVINMATKQNLLDQKIPADKIQIINPGLDLAKFQFLPKNQTNENSTDPFEIVSVGYLFRRKGIDLLIEAVKILKIEIEKEEFETNLEQNKKENEPKNENLDNLQNWQNQQKMQNLETKVTNKEVNLRIKNDLKPKIHLNILGDGPQIENLKKLVLDYKLSENVTFVGFVDNSKVAEFYQKADVFVSMSRSESWGQMYLEAMACGVPIITTQNVGSDEIIENGKTGILVPQESVEQLVESLKFLIQNPAKKLEIAQKARTKLEQNYDWSKIIDQYENMYDKLLKT